MGRRNLGMKKYSKDLRGIKKQLRKKSKNTNRETCDHDYSDGTGTGWHICIKCGDMY